MEGGTATALDGVVTAIVNMGSSVADSLLDMITQLLPVFGPVIAAIVIVFLGRTLIKRFGGGR